MPLSRSIPPIRKSVLALLISFVFFSVVRSPGVLFGGRFYAEEGAVFWARAKSNSAWDVLTFNPKIGYFQFSTNLQALISSHLPDRLAPIFTSWTSLICSAISAVLLLTVPSRLCHKGHEKLVLAIIVLFGSAVTEPDIFANSIQLQVHFGILAVVIFFFDWEKISTPISLFVIFPFLIFVGISSMHTAIMAIPYVILICYRYSRSKLIRSNIKLGSMHVAATASVLALLIQASFFITSKRLEKNLSIHPHNRGHGFGINDFGSFIASNFATNLRGRESSNSIFEIFQINPLWGNLVSVTFILLTLYLALSIFRPNSVFRKDNLHTILTVLFLYYLYTIESLIGYVSPIPSARYQVIPSCILAIFLFLLVNQIRFQSVRVLFLSIFGALLLYSSINGMSDDPWGALKCDDPCVSWETQISEANSGRRVTYQFWPYFSEPPFLSPVSVKSGFCKNFNALQQFVCLQED